jgi:hypothetical protein
MTRRLHFDAREIEREGTPMTRSGWDALLMVVLMAGAVSAQQLTVCVTTTGGGQTRQVELDLVGIAENSPSFVFSAALVGETTDLQPASGSLILRHGGVNVYYGIQGPASHQHSSSFDEGGSVNLSTLVGAGRRTEVGSDGSVSSTLVEARIQVGACQ